ncbi:twinkle mtDNA helicase-like [Mya arenaria]|uniref:twinkle mtDNA helicase-like n=1 Tax=Mya arenaria TaxID=6604 RepID=UPI0022E87D25|nr:twinkle mtDNA helicase-like [Mya arenaria]
MILYSCTTPNQRWLVLLSTRLKSLHTSCRSKAHLKRKDNLVSVCFPVLQSSETGHQHSMRFSLCLRLYSTDGGSKDNNEKTKITEKDGSSKSLEDTSKTSVSVDQRVENRLTEQSEASSERTKVAQSTAQAMDFSESFPKNGTGEIVKVLNEFDIPYKKGHTCYFTVCPKLGRMAMKRMKDHNLMYINAISGYFRCSVCGKSGDWPYLQDNYAALAHLKPANRKHMECFKDVRDVKVEPVEPHKEVLRRYNQAQDFSALSDDEFENLLSIFDWSGLHQKTFQKFGVRWTLDGGKYQVVFPVFSPQGVLTSLRVFTGSLSEEGDISVGPTHSYPKKAVDVFGWQILTGAGTSRRLRPQQVVITNREVNAMAVFQETGIPAFVLENASHLPQELLPYLEQFESIILWLGTDITAWQNTKPFAKKLDEKRVYIFRPTVLKHMPLECVQCGDDVRDVLDQACFISHKDVLSTLNLRDEVYAELQQFDKVAGVKWKRYEKLNEILKGHRRGELTVLTGPTGSGKTTFVSEYSLDLCMQGVNTLWGSFEINNVRLIKCMLQQFAGRNMTKHIKDFDEVYGEFSRLPMYFMRYFGQQNIDKVLEVMTQAVYIHDISHVVIDNLQFMMGMDYTEFNRWIKQDLVVSMFRQFATEKNCHVTLILHPRKVREGEELSTAAIFGSAKVTQEADNVILIQDQRLVKVMGKKYIQVVKNRFDGDLGMIQLNFDKASNSFLLGRQKQSKPKQPESVDESFQYGDIDGDKD